MWVIFYAAFLLLIDTLAHLFPLIDSIWVSYNQCKLHCFGFGLIPLPCILCCLSYTVSRAYLVAEAFVSIR